VNGFKSEEERIKEAVSRAYGAAARRLGEGRSRASCCSTSQTEGGCCGPLDASIDASAAVTGIYSAEELSDLPESVIDAQMGCGNPVAIAALRPGEAVLDLGSGGGIDCFLAARKVGPEGRVIGLDMTPGMIKLARRNAKRIGATNVEFRYGEIEEIPLPDDSIDVVLSNCVINLSPDKDGVFREVYRVLRPGGRMIISDIVTEGNLPESIRGSLAAWAGCVAGALEESDYLGRIHAAGFGGVEVLSRDYVRIGEAPGWESVRTALVEAGFSLDDVDRTIVSIRVKGHKPE
jgi:SAM-dependent methyltransferase